MKKITITTILFALFLVSCANQADELLNEQDEKDTPIFSVDRTKIRRPGTQHIN